MSLLTQLETKYQLSYNFNVHGNLEHYLNIVSFKGILRSIISQEEKLISIVLTIWPCPFEVVRLWCYILSPFDHFCSLSIILYFHVHVNFLLYLFTYTKNGSRWARPPRLVMSYILQWINPHNLNDARLGRHMTWYREQRTHPHRSRTDKRKY